MKKIECEKCKTLIRNCNFKKHHSACNGSYVPFIKSDFCKYCGLDISGLITANRANHVRWCKSNPKHAEYISELETLRGKIVNPRNQFTKAKDEGKPIPPGTMTGKSGSFLGKKHSFETIQTLREKALSSTHRRLVRSIREYTCVDGSKVMLDSSWEEVLAIRLDELGIIWNRPTEPIKWTDNKGTVRNYFPDFYLIEYNMYLDPKNPYAYYSQREKIEIILQLMPNLKILTTLQECKEFNV